MAFTVPCNLSIRMQDEMGVIAPVILYALLDSTQTLDNIVTDMQAAVTAVNTVSDAAVLTATMKVDVALPGGLNPLVAGARVEQTGLFNFNATGTPHRFGVDIVSFKNSKIAGGKIDLVDAAVAAFILFLHTALTTAEWVSNHKEVLTGLRDALISFRKRRRATTRVSFEV